MKSTKKVLALGMASVMTLSLLSACGNKSNTDNPSGGSNTGTLVVGDGNYDGKFSPFFYTSAYDGNIVTLNQLQLAGADREGAMILKGIEGETKEYNGTEYTYTGISDIEITQNADGTVYYDITLKDGVKFSDGHELDIDDVIFSMYVLCDPTYDGSSTLYGQPIMGMNEYRQNNVTLSALLGQLGENNTDFTFVTQEQQTAFWNAINDGLVKYCQEIVDYVKTAVEDDTLSVAAAAAQWGFELEADATVKDFALAMGNQYGWNFSSMEAETAGTKLADLIPEDVYNYYTVNVATGESAPNISGIQKTGDMSMRLVTTSLDATTIYQLSLFVAPMHYYGSEDKYDYENNQFGFPKGDLSSVRAKSSEPMGAGPYKFVSYENGTVALEANENYWKGEPKIKNINFKETTEADKISGVKAGTLDITDPSFSVDAIEEIAEANGGSKDYNGSVITINTVDNLGYGYVGINADNVRVGNDSASEASKNLRKGLATVLAVYRDVAIDSYYGEAANVINYPISDTSWAAPKVTDAGYQVAFSTDVDGNPIYTDGMSDDEKYAAAKEAALGFFQAAGYTVEGGKITAAPAGAKMSYELIIGGGGKGDHPSFMMCSLASEALAEIGMELRVTDIANSSDLFAQMEAGTAELFAAAWQATPDPDMYQIYHSQGNSNYNYDIKDPDLDEIIVAARSTTDQAARIPMYKEALDIVMDWAVELPIYQRTNCFIFSTERVNISTLTPDITTYWDWKNDIEKLELN
ncbi:ABC transporter substrate-binding protein [Pseudoflavonifractor sp. An85]|uniref:ABC transporter substrate-binding protein n=1 Tax=Pseudoflavonifractor sp. An85 TaxID=1965661 RepID=UPI000B395605|nr:ABC transporter substrate-binding protein [Pseudoflavonifractor sp. An85]OUN22224.1 ABC transporter substrate-binding protein [Pseudoflavonifractor sp. An85]